ncbi:MAG: helix-turn-helix domain-containing protein, partial [Oscillospiraceae bacterium]|nr:helix-turn-helix domain-containing protein [Oscillospiraceae bacterium]
MTIFSENLRRLRLSKKLTQEQAAEALHVSPQAVSRWECGNTFPDVLLLPAIARLYAVTIDDLYREKAGGYENYASRLISVYENTRDPKDFVPADEEYTRLLASGNVTMNDLRSYG